MRERLVSFSFDLWLMGGTIPGITQPISYAQGTKKPANKQLRSYLDYINKDSPGSISLSGSNSSLHSSQISARGKIIVEQSSR
jgi:hypothetical protein